jgi:hypothetical protein
MAGAPAICVPARAGSTCGELQAVKTKRRNTERSRIIFTEIMMKRVEEMNDVRDVVD